MSSILSPTLERSSSTYPRGAYSLPGRADFADHRLRSDSSPDEEHLLRSRQILTNRFSQNAGKNAHSNQNSRGEKRLEDVDGPRKGQ